MNATTNFIEALRIDLSADLEKSILDKIMPLIEQKLFSNNFDVDAAAAYMKVSASTMRRAAASKDVPFYRLRGQVFFRQQDLDKWIDDQVAINSKRVTPAARQSARSERR